MSIVNYNFFDGIGEDFGGNEPWKWSGHWLLKTLFVFCHAFFQQSLKVEESSSLFLQPDDQKAMHQRGLCNSNARLLRLLFLRTAIFGHYRIYCISLHHEAVAIFVSNLCSAAFCSTLWSLLFRGTGRAWTIQNGMLFPFFSLLHLLRFYHSTSSDICCFSSECCILFSQYAYFVWVFLLTWCIRRYLATAPFRLVSNVLPLISQSGR